MKFLALIILARWSSTVVFMLLLCGSSLAFAQASGAAIRTYRTKPTPVTRAAVERLAAGRSGSEAGLAQLALGEVALEQRQFDVAAQYLQDAAKRLPAVSDYVQTLLASAEHGRGNADAAMTAARAVIQHAPMPPWGGKAVLVAAKAYLAQGRPQEAQRLLENNVDRLPAPTGPMLLAMAAEAGQDWETAAQQYQRVYYQFPKSSDAAAAGEAIPRIQATMGASYPHPSVTLLLERVAKLANTGDASQARSELQAATAWLQGNDLQLARVRMGVAEYLARNNERAFQYLSSLSASGEADAERLFYVFSAARRLEREADAFAALEQLGQRYPASHWRIEGWMTAGNWMTVEHRTDDALRFYQGCAEAKPGDPEAAWCHWKLTWHAYQSRQTGVERLLEEHARLFPNSEKTASALYFLGRLAERRNDAATGRAFFEEVVSRYPNYYYGVVSRERLEKISATGRPNGTAAALLRSLPKPERSKEKPDFTMTALHRRRIERARLLRSGGFDDWAEEELRFGAGKEPQGQVLAMELARSAEEGGSIDQALRYMKRYAPGYLTTPLEQAPGRFWRHAFPLPYRAALERHSAANNLDMFLVAALIRQESEFNPRAVSPAKAHGLTQVMPATGREMSRSFGIRRFQSSMLFDPVLNIQMGTKYLRRMLNGLDGKWEATLAAYNAGKTRADRWLGWGSYQEPAEFIESIPFSETRNYVQSVLRNADMYRRLYGSGARTSPLIDEPSRARAERAEATP